MNQDYSLQYIGCEVSIQVDRPLGSKHTQHEIYYPVNYGFVSATKAPDGEEIDAYLLGVFEPVTAYTGKCIAVIRRIEDNDDKLVIAPSGKSFTDEQIIALTEFQERFFPSKIIRAENR